MRKASIYLLLTVLIAFSPSGHSSEPFFELRSIEVIFPVKAYTKEESSKGLPVWVIRQEFKKKYYEEFSKYFVHHPSQFSEMSRNDSGDYAIELNFRIQNRADAIKFADQLFIELIFEEPLDFPWEKLTVFSPRIDFNNFENMIINDGVGPALNIGWQVVLNPDVVLFKGKEEILWSSDSIDIPLYSPSIPFKIMEVKDGLLESPLYLELPTAPKKLFDPRYYECGDDWYEKISTAKRLKEVTDTIHGNGVDIKCEYDSLSKKGHKSNFKTNLPENLIYFKKDEFLLSILPKKCKKNIVEPPLEPTIDIPARSENREEIPSLNLYHNPNCVFKEYEFDAEDITLKGDKSKKFVDVKRKMNPGGVIELKLIIINPHNGFFRVKIGRDGEELYVFKLEALSPPTLRFNPKEKSHYLLLNKPKPSKKAQK